MSIESVMPSNPLILCPPLLLLPSVLPSIRAFSNELALHIRWPSYWSFNVSISPAIECSGLIYFRIDWFYILAVQGNLQSKSRAFSSTTFKSIILRPSVFFMVQLSHLYTTTGKTIALTIWTFVSKVMFLLFNMLSRFVFTTKEPASFEFMATVTICSDFQAQENKIRCCFPFLPICREVMGPDGMIFVF